MVDSLHASPTDATTLHPILGERGDYDALLEAIDGSSVVLIGEGTHGTHEFYRERARITQRLIDERGFTAVAVEGDWPDAYQVNRYVMGLTDRGGALASLEGFQRFPTWMWRNQVVLEFVRWLRATNDARSLPTQKVRFYGLDFYSLHTSIGEVIRYLEEVDPPQSLLARQRYSCFDLRGDDGQAYGFATAYQGAARCEDQVVAQLLELYAKRQDYLAKDGMAAEDEQFCAEQNALVVQGAEQYYHEMYRAEVSSWNLRDQHMATTLARLRTHLAAQNGLDGQSKIVVWEHNSHIGDARATAMSGRGELNVGQLARQTYGADAYLIGATTYDGWVTAASDWGTPADRKRVRPGRPGSHEAVLHSFDVPQFWLDTSTIDPTSQLTDVRLERAIGVLYRPVTELQSHYFEAHLPRQFDALVHIDRTRALEPLDRTAHWDEGEPPETYPSGI
jgi:erythromycin esterase-like protein